MSLFSFELLFVKIMMFIDFKIGLARSGPVVNRQYLERNIRMCFCVEVCGRWRRLLSSAIVVDLAA